MQLRCGLKPYLKPIVILGGSFDFTRYSSLYRVQFCEPHKNCPCAAYIGSLFPPFHLLTIILSPITIISSICQPSLAGPTKLSTTSDSSSVLPVYPQLICNYLSAFPMPITPSQALPSAELPLPSTMPALFPFSDLPQSFILKSTSIY